MYEMLKLAYEYFKVAVADVLSEGKEKILEMNEKTHIFSCLLFGTWIHVRTLVVSYRSRGSAFYFLLIR
jgi:hypothetical protein